MGSADRDDVTAQPGSFTTGRRRNNWTATTDPTVNDDDRPGLAFEVGSRWLNTVTRVIWSCARSDEGNALWTMGGVLDHGALLGLTPDDDHTQYALMDSQASDPGTPGRPEAFWFDTDETPAVLPASAVPITDGGGYFTGTQVEAALQELGLAVSGGSGGAHPGLSSHDSMGLATDAELAAHAAAGDPHPGYATDADLTAHAATPHGGSANAIVRVYTPTGSPHTWSKPAGLVDADFEVQGGGGSAGGCAATSTGQGSSSGGGGAGGYTRKRFKASDLPSTLTLTVGTGGAAPAAGNNNGNNGNLSKVEGTGITTVQANGGTGGAGSANAAGTGRRAGGQGGSTSGGDFNVIGSDGGEGWIIGNFGITIGHGGASWFGPMRRANTGADGQAGVNGSGGGGQAEQASQPARAGGKGGDGLIVVTEYY